ncbi:MAG: tetratricopeptide repeat protein [Roseobacter sp.]
MKLSAIVFICAAGPAFASCPAPPNYDAALTGLVAQANAASNDAAGREISAQMWELWLEAPDATAQAVLDKGMQARSSFDYTSAADAFSELIEYCPDYAEGFNQRAFISFLREDYAAALEDLEQALLRSPNHVGAQSGRALTLMNLGRLAEARLQLKAALENNPWLSERFLLADGAPLADHSEDI